MLANPDQIKSLWNNLISNAIKYNRDGGRVEVVLGREGRRLVARVSDTGIGIPPEAMKRLFSEFFRADNAKTHSRAGTGLGLSIIKEIVERAGGEITVESALDQGTTFRFWLPAITPQGSLTRQEMRRPRLPNQQSPRRRLRVEIHGAVQGVGFRPFVYRLATELGLTGWVINDARGVFIEVEGAQPALDAFFQRLPAETPPLARVRTLDSEWLEPSGFTRLRDPSQRGHRSEDRAGAARHRDLPRLPR